MTDYLKGRTPGARLNEIETAIRALEEERKQHLDRRPPDVVAKLTGDPAAAERVAAIDSAVEAIDARLRDLREAAAELRRRIGSEAEAARRAEVETRPRRVAELARNYRKAVQNATRNAAAMAAELRALDKFAHALIAELGDQQAIRALSQGARLHRLQSGIARLFTIDASRPLSTENSLLGIASYEVGERSHWTPEQHEQAALDNLAPFYATLPEAEAARDALAAGGPKHAIVPLPGAFTLVRPEHVFGDRAAAERAARTMSAPGNRAMVILPHDGGWVLLDARFAVGDSPGGAKAA